PNPFHVYLHDTPARALFKRARRDFSHGCMRVEKPLDLARFLLQGTGWTDARMRAAMASGVEQPVPLPAPIPVYVTYFTAWVDPDGRVRYAPDIYGHDAAQGAALQASRPTSSPTIAPRS